MWYKLTDKYNNIKYKQGGWDIKEGIDCISMILLFMKDIGKDVDDYINGTKSFNFKGNELTSKNFLHYLKDNDEIQEALYLFVKENCKKVNKKRKGDICFVSITDNVTAGIYIGQGNLMYIAETSGIKKIKIRNFNLLGIYRWV